jgi:hypothetical protein
MRLCRFTAFVLLAAGLPFWTLVPASAAGPWKAMDGQKWKGFRIHIYYSGGMLNGINACGCRDRGFNALLVRAKSLEGALKRFSQRGDSLQNAVIMDEGGFGALFAGMDRNETDLLLKHYRLLIYDAVNLRGLKIGKETAWLDRLRERLQVPFVSANVFNGENGEPYAWPYVLKRLNGKDAAGDGPGEVRIGIFGLTSPDTIAPSPDPAQEGRTAEVWDPLQSAQAVTELLRKETDVIVCLADISLNAAKKLVSKGLGIDLLILGHSIASGVQQTTAGKALILQTGRKDPFMGDLTLYLDKKKNIAGYQNALIPLDIGELQPGEKSR